MVRDLETVPQYFSTASSRSIIANRISYVFNWHGPSFVIDTACSSSAVALHSAVQSLRAGDSDMAVATGANLISDEADPLVIFEKQLESAGILSPQEMTELREKYNQEFLELSKQVREEPLPDASTIYDYTYAGQKGRYW